MKPIKKIMVDADAMFAFGNELGESAANGEVLALCGELGAGKTCFVQGLAAGLGYDGPVSSPSFPILHEYWGGRLALFHFDFYRLESEHELVGIDFDEYTNRNAAVLAIEWADKFPSALPECTRWLEFRIMENGERLVQEITQ